MEFIAHRGASHYAPENTIAGLKLAWAQAADASELDVHFTKDQQIVVIHDKDTERTAGVKLDVRQSTLAELKQLDIGRWKGEAFADERIPTLEEFLANVPVGKKLFIEVKCGPEIVPELTRQLAASKLKPEQVPVISFKSKVIAAYKKARPNSPAYWLVELDKKDRPTPTVESLLKTAKEIGADGLDLSATESLNRNFADAVKREGLKLYVWTVDDPVIARRMTSIGVDGITTNRPAWLRERLLPIRGTDR